MLLVVPFGDKKAFGKGHLPYCNTAKEGRKKREQSQFSRICKGEVCCQKKRRNADFGLSRERWPSKKDRVQARITSCDVGAIDQARYEARCGLYR